MIILDLMRLSGQYLQNAIHSVDSSANGIAASQYLKPSTQNDNDFVDYMVDLTVSVRHVQATTKAIKAEQEMFGYILDLFA